MATAPRRLTLGLDPGQTTGRALACASSGRLLSVESGGPLATVRALDALAMELDANGRRIAGVWIEDARDLPLYARNRNANRGERDRIARSVGGVDALTALYAALCESHGWTVHLAAPQRRKKWDADEFKRLTGWAPRTNEHGRDAARLVFGRTIPDRALGRPAEPGRQRGGRTTKTL